MDNQDAVVLTAVFRWAWRNNISVSFYQEYHIGDISPYPVLRFSREGNHISCAFRALTDIGERMEFEWRKIALALCVQPFVAPGVSIEEDSK